MVSEAMFTFISEPTKSIGGSLLQNMVFWAHHHQVTQ